MPRVFAPRRGFDAARWRQAARFLCRASKDPRRYLMPLAGGKRRFPPYGRRTDGRRLPPRGSCRRRRLKESGKDRKTREKRQGDETPSVSLREPPARRGPRKGPEDLLGIRALGREADGDSFRSGSHNPKNARAVSGVF